MSTFLYSHSILSLAFSKGKLPFCSTHTNVDVHQRSHVLLPLIVVSSPFHSAFCPSSASPAAWEGQKVHLAPCPCGADHVARTVLGHFYTGVGRIWNCPWRYLIVKIWSKLKKKKEILCHTIQFRSAKLNVRFQGVSLFFFFGSFLPLKKSLI